MVTRITVPLVVMVVGVLLALTAGESGVRIAGLAVVVLGGIGLGIGVHARRLEKATAAAKQG